MARAPSNRSVGPRGPEATRSGPRFQFFREIIGELKRTVWPTREQAARLTTVVIVISLFVSVILGMLDIVLGRLFRFLIG